MEFIWIIIALLAACSGSALVVNLLPFSINKRLNPMVMFLSALIALALPHVIILALAMTIPMGLIYGWTGIRLQGHEPVKLPVDQAITLAKRIKVPKKAEVSTFLDRSYPDPGGHVEKFVPEL
jgi:hypothetical protein